MIFFYSIKCFFLKWRLKILGDKVEVRCMRERTQWRRGIKTLSGVSKSQAHQNAAADKSSSHLRVMDMAADDLKVIWICKDCRATFVFHTDSEIHIEQSGHHTITAYDIETGKMREEKSFT